MAGVGAARVVDGSPASITDPRPKCRQPLPSAPAVEPTPVRPGGAINGLNVAFRSYTVLNATFSPQQASRLNAYAAEGW